MINTKEFLEMNTLEAIGQTTMSNPFKNYKPLDKGNTKLYKSILSFSLLPYVTCPMKCKSCYDVKSLRYESVRDKRLYNTYLAINAPEELQRSIVKQILNSKSVKFIRIHVGGDFFSNDYVNMWIKIKELVNTIKPEIGFYTYTKTEHGELLRKHGINVVRSILPDGSFNYGPLDKLEKIKAMDKKYSICPAYKKDDSIICGKTCTLCMKKEAVLFVQH